jgi:hypothetical protein
MSITSPHETASIAQVRRDDPGAIAKRLRERPRFPGFAGIDKLLVIAADHPARGSLSVAGDERAMADRHDLLRRIQVALSRPGVHGFLGTADLVEELALLGALDHKLVLGSMNRGGIAGTTFELDDRFSGYDARGVAEAGLEGGKMLLRIDPDDAASVATMEACARAVDELAERGLIALVEPFWSSRIDGKVRNDLSADAVIRSITIASGLGRTSAYTWLKLPAVEEMDRVLAATTMPVLLLGGEVGAGDPSDQPWRAAAASPAVAGLAVGRALLYPPDGDVAAAVDEAVELL